ncbi:MAG: PUA domain-containing protein [Nitrososphaerota archaeon]|nr:PUA domain-containing protein [Nitrososphaerota archaeon]
MGKSKLHRRQIRRKEAIKIIDSAKTQKISFKQEKFDLAEILEIENASILILSSIPTLIIFPDGKIIPHIQGLGRITTCPVVVVDKGAVEHIVKGADVMIPGVVKYSEFRKGDPVAIVSEEYIVIAVGIALQDSESISKERKGKIVKNLHNPNDIFFKECLTTTFLEQDEN